MILPKNYLERLGADRLYDLAKFVVNENFKHHTSSVYPENYTKEIGSILKEEKDYFNNAQIFVSKDVDNSIIGSIRVLRWNYTDVLPIQKIFGINPLLLNGHCIKSSIWHIGRFAIKKGVNDINLFKRLMVCAIAPICQDKNAVVYAECDSKLLRVMLALGIKAVPVEKPLNYLGSETIPVSMRYNGLIDFYNKNRSLVPVDFLGSTTAHQLPKRVVSQPLQHNYSLV
ncbi:hypothetical protein [Zobellia uliginosa]|uniref:hypothetical protein n=1 Tax=Zobellia uliginosa TaxID=143224 RepID=UPI0026E2971F|nr:hypothetical protein [Zobellia uliginosa]MDO6518587.1 hypothetical protein [Zobellia uliginosa]